jgi:hypothetical protein
MPEFRVDPSAIRFQDLFPWLKLFRAASLARDVKKIVLGAVSAILVAAGWWLMTAAVIGDRPVEPAVAEGADLAGRLEANRVYSERLARYQQLERARRMPWDIVANEPDPWRSPLTARGWTGSITDGFRAALVPVETLIRPAGLILSRDGSMPIGIAMLLWTVAVQAVFGGAICRIAGLQLARDGTSIGPAEAVRFSASRFFHFALPPLLPIAGVLLLAGLVALGGLLLWVPGANVVAAAVWFLPITAGLVMAVALAVLAAGWPLMFPASAVQATEAFDALSRSYSYVIARPWSYLWQLIVAAAVATVSMTVALVVAWFAVSLAWQALGVSAGETNVRQLYAFAPDAGGWRSDFGPTSEAGMPTGVTRIAALVTGFWLHLTALAVIGFAWSLFWTLATQIYFLLRKEVDDTDPEEIWVEEPEEEPFPTIIPTLAGGGLDLTPRPPNPLQIIDPPR